MAYFGSSIVTGLSVVGVVALIVFGIQSCDEREARVRSECIQAGGTVVLGSGTSQSHCIRK